MPVMQLHLVADRFGDDRLREVQHECARHYGEILGAPMERIRIIVTEHRPETVFVDGRLASDGADDAPYFEYAVLAGRPASEIEALMRGFTDIVERVLGVERGRIRGVCRPAEPEHWGIGGTLAGVARAGEIAARTGSSADDASLG